MRSAVVLLAVVGASPALASELDTLCTWSSARWEQRATLRFVGTDLPFAEAWQHDDVRLGGTLGLDAFGNPRFRVDLAGGGLTVAGDIDPNEEAVFSLLRGVRLGESGVMLPGALIAVRGASPSGDVAVGPHRWAAEGLWLASTGSVPCEDITVHWRMAPDEDALLAAAEFPATGAVRVLPKGRAVAIRATPGGAWVGSLRARGYDHPLRVGEESDGWSYVADPHWTGTVWYGWVRTRRLADPDPSGASDSVFGLLGATPSTTIPVRRCEGDAPLRASVGGWVAQVGTVRAGTAFEVVEERDGAWSVRFPEGWIAPAEGAALWVPADPARCPEGVVLAPGFSGLEDLLAPMPTGQRP